MASRKISDLHPQLQPLAEKFIEQCEEAGIDVIITCTFRSPEEQAYQYSRGRKISSGIGVTPWRPLGRIVTRAKPGQSKHNYMIDGKPAAEAFDFVPVRNGKAIWNASDPAWQVCGNIGMKLGLNWYGRPDAPFREFPHMQLIKKG